MVKKSELLAPPGWETTPIHCKVERSARVQVELMTVHS